MTPFQKAYIPPSESDALVKELLRKPHEWFEQFLGPNPTDLAIHSYIYSVIDDLLKDEVWKNDVYQVSVREADIHAPHWDWPKMWQLSIKRIDRAPIHDWRDLQRIKNELIGPLNEGVELYPSESRLMDTANQYFLYVLADPAECFPFGIFFKRHVTDESLGKSVNRSLETI